MKIVISGSLGHISLPLTKTLVQQGHDLTVITSKQDRQKEIEALGAAAAIGSLDDQDFLTATIREADALYAMIPPNYAEPDHLAYYRRIGSNYAQAAGKTALKRLVHLSSIGANLDSGTGFILGSHEVEGILNQLPRTTVTHLRPGYFYYNLFSFMDMIKNLGFIGTNYGGEDRILMVSPRDIAEAAAEELVKGKDAQKVRYIASGDYTGNQAALIIGTAIGKPDLRWITTTDDQVRQGLENAGLSKTATTAMIEMGQCIHDGSLRADFDLHPPLVMGKVKLADFAEEFAAVFKNGY